MIFELFLLFSMMSVASNPSPHYAVLGLVWGGGMGCLVLMKWGVSFLCLVLFLVYLGGMMVVFGYSVALVAEPYPKAWGSGGVLVYLGIYSMLLMVGWVGWGVCSMEVVGELGVETVLVGWWGVSVLFSGGWLLMLSGWALFLSLFVVLEIVEFKCGALRAV
uniref:NADH-ubiquinone oxidoreductase chain 6 n=1 Tax=Cornufer vitianus TaxID=1582976 RepID=A0A0K0LFK0_CORVT|nr:NADH dehydrogenase subunit 6 [Cornufer vitianus]AIZ97086.1 NADH dehydrogenase subunit 6 [Cornufer vitianus]